MVISVRSDDERVQWMVWSTGREITVLIARGSSSGYSSLAQHLDGET